MQEWLLRLSERACKLGTKGKRTLNTVSGLTQRLQDRRHAKGVSSRAYNFHVRLSEPRRGHLFLATCSAVQCSAVLGLLWTSGVLWGCETHGLLNRKYVFHVLAADQLNRIDTHPCRSCVAWSGILPGVSSTKSSVPTADTWRPS